MTQFKEALAGLCEGIEKELEREVFDTHDYSSGRYSGYDDGYNAGVYEALEKLQELIEDPYGVTGLDDGENEHTPQDALEHVGKEGGLEAVVLLGSMMISSAVQQANTLRGLFEAEQAAHEKTREQLAMVESDLQRIREKIAALAS